MIVDVIKTVDIIKQDLENNQDELFNRIEYYTRKYRGDILNDINVGLFLDDHLRPTAQIYVANKTGIIKHLLIFNSSGKTIIKQETPINTFKMKRVKIYEFDHKLYEGKTVDELIKAAKFALLDAEEAGDVNEIEAVKHYPVNGFMRVELFLKGGLNE